MTTTCLASQIQREYGVELPFFYGTFEEATREAQNEGMYLLLYLHSPTHEDTYAFLTGVLSAPLFQDLLGTRLLLYATSVMEPEGRRLELDMQATTFPFLAMMLKRDVVLRVMGFFAAEEVLQKIRMAFDQWDGHLAEERLLRQELEREDRARLEEERRELEMQSADRERIRQYEERERARRERAEQLRREEEERERLRREEEEAQRRRREEEERRHLLLQETRAAAMARLPAEPLPDAEASTVVFISLRSTCGAKYQRRFFRTDRVSSLRDYAMSLEDYRGEKFQLVAGYPPRSLEADEDKIFGDVQILVPKAVVLMRSV